MNEIFPKIFSLLNPDAGGRLKADSGPQLCFQGLGYRYYKKILRIMGPGITFTLKRNFQRF